VRALARAGTAAGALYSRSQQLKLGRRSVKVKHVGLPSTLKHGMCPKKEHEAARLFPLVSHQAKQAGCHSVINFGEGKGYVSRLLALESNLQVIGLDCNPAHGEASDARLHRMMDEAAETDGTLYRTRGRLVSATVRVGPSVDWEAVLEPHGLLSQPQVDSGQPRPEEDALVLKVRCEKCGSVVQSKSYTLASHRAKCGTPDDHFSPYLVSGPRQFSRGVHVGLTTQQGDVRKRSVVRVLGFNSALKQHRVIDPSTGAKSVVDFECEGCEVDVVSPTIPTSPRVAPDLANVAMMGLHTCGDLGSSVLRNFVASKSPTLVLVSCCWHALSRDGFPLSNAVRSMSTASGVPRWRFVTNVSTMLATQPMDAWRDGEEGMSASSSKLMFFRALLPIVFGNELCNRPDPLPWSETDCSHRGGTPLLQPAFLRRVSKGKASMSFVEFVECVRAEYFPELDPETQRCRASLTWEKRKVELPRFMAFQLLRMLTAPIVEGALLLDRLLFLHESLPPRSRVALLPLFDGRVSPRMFALVAQRAL